MLALGVAAVAGCGAVCRYVADTLISRRRHGAFPWGTLVINVAGSLALGLTLGLATHHGLSAATAVVIGSGFCGGFTTFSTWMWESLALAETGALKDAGLYVVLSLALGLSAAGLGLWLTQ